MWLILVLPFHQKNRIRRFSCIISTLLKDSSCHFLPFEKNFICMSLIAAIAFEGLHAFIEWSSIVTIVFLLSSVVFGLGFSILTDFWLTPDSHHPIGSLALDTDSATAQGMENGTAQFLYSSMFEDSENGTDRKPCGPCQYTGAETLCGLVGRDSLLSKLAFPATSVSVV